MINAIRPDNQNYKKTNLKYPFSEKGKLINTTLQGVLVNNYLKDDRCGVDFDEVCDTLMISGHKTANFSPEYNIKENKKSFDAKKAILPLAIGTLGILAAIVGGAFLLRAGARKRLDTKRLDTGKFIEQLPDLGINNNIKHETEFATYRVIRDPSTANIAAAVAVFVFSGMTALAKNFVDGIKEIWIKKQEADIERDLQENLIAVETKSFSGKLSVVNELLIDSVGYFKTVLNKDQKNDESTAFFGKYFSFLGNKIKNTNEKSGQTVARNNTVEKIKKVVPLVFTGIAALTACFFAGKYSINSIRKTLLEADDFANKCAQKTIETIDNIAQTKDVAKLPHLKELFEILPAKTDYIRDSLIKMGITDEIEIVKFVSSVQESSKSIFADAPTALGGIPKKLQYYCYLDEPRGHLYNWFLSRKKDESGKIVENKFLKYIFASFSVIGGTGYLFNEGMSAVKTIAVNRENSKTELSLKKRLVEVEIENFKSKKNSAIEPLMDNFNYHLKHAKSREELRRLAENILYEIKNGPPYVYS